MPAKAIASCSVNVRVTVKTSPHCSPSSVLFRMPEIWGKRKLPCFRNEVFAETVMPFFLGDAKSGFLVHMAGCIEFTLRPQNYFLVSHLLCEAHTLAHEPRAYAQPTRGRLYIQ